MQDSRILGRSVFLGYLKNVVWSLGIMAWMFGTTDRTIAVFSDGSISAIDIIQLLTALFFLIAWLILKPFKLSTEKS